MNNYVATLYSHKASFDLVTNEAKRLFPKAEWEYERKNEFTIAVITIKNGLFQGKKKLKISYRERDELGFELEKPACAVTNNLAGMYNLVNSIQTKHEKAKSLVLQKIKTINSEISINNEGKAEKEFKTLVSHLATKCETLIFSQPRTGLMNSLQQAWLNQDLDMLLDMEGDSNSSELDVKIDAKHFDDSRTELPEQVQRKNKSELLLRKHGIKVNESLPAISRAGETKFRDPKEIAERTIALAVTNLVAFNNISGEQALQFANKNEIINTLSPKEIEFLKNPTTETKNQETWKCECIWTLSWALGIVPALNFPKDLADLADIPSDQYPVGSELSPREFIAKCNSRRSDADILDANDLYYRMDWACVDARLKDETIVSINPGVVYERHYALNWLIGYRNQEWDHISTDT